MAHWVGGYVPPTWSMAEYDSLARNLQRWAFEEDYADVEYNFGVSPTGIVYELRGWAYQSGANGTTEWNQRGLAVCYFAGRTADGSKVTPFTDEAKDAFKWLWDHGREQIIEPHSKVRPTYTECPGDAVRDWLPALPIHGEDDMTPQELQEGLDAYFSGPKGQARLRQAIKTEIAATDSDGNPNTLLSGVRHRVVQTDSRTARIEGKVGELVEFAEALKALS